jgi:hypothetical protein
MRDGKARHPHNLVVRIDNKRDTIALATRHFAIDEHVLQFPPSRAPSGRNRSPGRRLRTNNGNRIAPPAPPRRQVQARANPRRPIRASRES